MTMPGHVRPFSLAFLSLLGATIAAMQGLPVLASATLVVAATASIEGCRRLAQEGRWPPRFAFFQRGGERRPSRVPELVELQVLGGSASSGAPLQPPSEQDIDQLGVKASPRTSIS